MDKDFDTEIIPGVIDSPEVPGPVFDEAVDYESIKKIGESPAFGHLRDEVHRRGDDGVASRSSNSRK